MNDRSDMDRVLRDWFSDGPATMPDRVVDVIADRIGHQRQRRAWRLQWRLPMNPIMKLAATAAVVVVVAIIGWNLLPGRPSGPGGPAAPTAPRDVALAWVDAANRGDAEAMLRLYAPGPNITEFGLTKFRVSAPDLAAFHDGLDCAVAIRSESVVDDVVQLVVVAGNGVPGETCPLPGEIIVERITVVDGLITSIDLSAPERTSALVTPVTYVLPAGWSTMLDVPGSVSIGPDSARFIGLWPDWNIARQDTCGAVREAEPGMGRTVDDLVTWLTGHPGLVASAPATVTRDGIDGRVLDVERKPGWTDACGDSAYLFTHQGTIGDEGGLEVRPNDRMRLYFFDVGDGHVVNIAIVVDDKADFDAFVTEATPVVETMIFE